MLSQAASRVLGAAALMLGSFNSHAGLIVNGDFEMHAVNAGSWSWMPSSQIDGWQGSNMEIWHGMNGVQAASGQHFIELNAHGANQGPWSIFQSFDTHIGQQYQLSFYYRARSNNNEQFRLQLDDANWLFDDHTTQGWAHYNNFFVAKTSSMTLRFTSLNAGTMGNLLDAIQVNAMPAQQAAAVPAPAGIGAFTLGLAALMAGRLRRRKL